MTRKRIFPWLLFFLVFILLYYTSYPSIGWWDSGAYTANAYNFGIPDPGGSILFVLLGRIFIMIFFFLSAAKAVTLVSIISASLTAVFTYYILILVLNNLPLNSPNYIKIIASFFTALSVPFLYSIWAEANVSREYILGLFLTSLLIYSSLKIWFTESESEKMRFIFFIAFVLGLDFTAHRLNTPFIPVVLLLLIFPLRKQLKQYKFWIFLAVVYILGLSLNLFILIRSPLHPPVSMDNVSNFSQLFAWIKMSRYGQSNFSNIFNRFGPFWSYQVNHMYLRYFWWNFLGTIGSGGIFNSIYFSYLPFALGLAGFVYSLIKRFKVWILIFAAFLFFSLGLVIYSNIPLGFDQIREIDRLFIPSFFVFILWTGIGFYLLIILFEYLVKKLKLPGKSIILILSAAGFIILPLNIITSNWQKNNKNKFYFPYEFAYNLLTGCKKNAILFTNGDNDTFPLWCLQSVDGIRPDIAVINLSLLNADYYVAQIQREYKLFPSSSEVLKPDKFRGSYIKSPVEIKIPLIDSLKQNDKIDTLKAKYSGRSFGKKQGLLPQDKALIALLEYNKWRRPVYFSNTVNKESKLGLSKYTATTGMAAILTPVKGDSILPAQLEENLLKKYNYNYFNDPSVFVDSMTTQLYDSYRKLFVSLAKYYLNSGNKKKALRIFSIMQFKLPEWRFKKEWNKYIEEFKKELGK